MSIPESDLRQAERVINHLIQTANRNKGKVYIVDKDNPDMCIKLDRPIKISYFMALPEEEKWVR